MIQKLRAMVDFGSLKSFSFSIHSGTNWLFSLDNVYHSANQDNNPCNDIAPQAKSISRLIPSPGSLRIVGTTKVRPRCWWWPRQNYPLWKLKFSGESETPGIKGPEKQPKTVRRQNYLYSLPPLHLHRWPTANPLNSRMGSLPQEVRTQGRKKSTRVPNNPGVAIL